MSDIQTTRTGVTADRLVICTRIPPVRIPAAVVVAVYGAACRSAAIAARLGASIHTHSFHWLEASQECLDSSEFQCREKNEFLR